jgi:hypothetical protein
MTSVLIVVSAQTRATQPGTLPGIGRIPGKRLMAAARVFEREFDASCDNLDNVRIVRTYELRAIVPSSQLRGHFSGRADRI